MVSNTQQTERIRARKHRGAGVRRKRSMRANGTPAFPVHPVGYDPNAADARPAAKPAAAPGAAAKPAPAKK
jgi:hypothetical protein